VSIALVCSACSGPASTLSDGGIDASVGGGGGGARESAGGGSGGGGTGGGVGGGQSDAGVDAGSGGGLPDAAITDGGPPVGPYLLRETFNAMPTGAPPVGAWTIDTSDGGSVLIGEVPFPADKSAELKMPAPNGLASLSATLPPQSGRIVLEAKVLTRETAGFKAIPYVYDAAGNPVASVSFQDGFIQTHIGATTTMIQPLVANVWYRVRVVVDTLAGTFDLYVDGVRKEHGAALRTASPAISKVRYYVDGASAASLLVDNVTVYSEASFIGSPPAPVFDPRTFGALGNGTTNDTAAIQRAVDAAAGTGGSVLLANGTFLSGTLTLKSRMTFFIASSATLLGSTAVADYPTQSPPTGNTQRLNCARALLYAPQATELRIDGGGTLDGQGDAFGGLEATRPMLIWTVLSSDVTIRNLYLKKGAVWSLVTMETDHVRIDNVNVQSDNITHDGIDVVDGTDVVVQNCAVTSGDDAMCLKSGVRRGLVGITVRDSIFTGSNGGSNGIKFGTATYGAVKDITIEDVVVKNIQYAAMAVESRHGSDVDGVAFRRIEISNVGSAFFVYLAQQSTTAPTGDVPKLGSINDVSFTDIRGSTASWGASPHQGSLITGHIFNGTVYRITNLAFTNVNLSLVGGRTSIPASPPEAMPNQYPEANMFGDLPAWGYYLRHVKGVQFSGCTSTLANSDVRQKLVGEDLTGLTGMP
jgi:hypothetical protein